jgi:hypothetical protein
MPAYRIALCGLEGTTRGMINASTLDGNERVEGWFETFMCQNRILSDVGQS